MNADGIVSWPTRLVSMSVFLGSILALFPARTCFASADKLAVSPGLAFLTIACILDAHKMFSILIFIFLYYHRRSFIVLCETVDSQ